MENIDPANYVAALIVATFIFSLYQFLFKFVLNDARLMSYLKKNLPERWNEVASRQSDLYEFNIAKGPFNPKVIRHFKYALSDEDCHFPEVLELKTKIRAGWRFGIIGIILVPVEMILIFFTFQFLLKQ